MREAGVFVTGVSDVRLLAALRPACLPARGGGARQRVTHAVKGGSLPWSPSPRGSQQQADSQQAEPKQAEPKQAEPKQAEPKQEVRVRLWMHFCWVRVAWPEMPPRLLFVSKPIGPPYHDGTKCLVRDIALHLRTVTPVIMTARGAAPFANSKLSTEHIVNWSVYAGAGKFQPGLGQNLRAVWSLLSGADADIWHFVFAPNPKSSMMGAWLKRARAVPALQTIASPPRRFDDPGRLVFGDIVVAQSQWTRQRLEAAFKDVRKTPPRLEVIPPPLAELAPRSPAEQAEARARLRIRPEQPVFVYPGDLETSCGGRAVRNLVAPLRERLPEAVVVFAYRPKTDQAPIIAAELERDLDPEAVRFVSEVPDILALLAGASAVLFPVDDLWGKVDIPIVLLESMELGVPVIVLDAGPLSDLTGVVKVPDTSEKTLLEAALALVEHDEHRRSVVSEQRASVNLRYRAATIARAYEKLYSELLTANRAYSLER